MMSTNGSQLDRCPTAFAEGEAIPVPVARTLDELRLLSEEDKERWWAEGSLEDRIGVGREVRDSLELDLVRGRRLLEKCRGQVQDVYDMLDEWNRHIIAWLDESERKAAAEAQGDGGEGKAAD